MMRLSRCPHTCVCARNTEPHSAQQRALILSAVTTQRWAPPLCDLFHRRFGQKYAPCEHFAASISRLALGASGVAVRIVVVEKLHQ
jgi:hypothetical protein